MMPKAHAVVSEGKLPVLQCLEVLGIMEHKMETTIGIIGIYRVILYWVYIELMEKEMETTI